MVAEPYEKSALIGWATSSGQLFLSNNTPWGLFSRFLLKFCLTSSQEKTLIFLLFLPLFIHGLVVLCFVVESHALCRTVLRKLVVPLGILLQHACLCAPAAAPAAAANPSDSLPCTAAAAPAHVAANEQDGSGDAYSALGFSNGFQPRLPGDKKLNPYLRLLPMLAGIG